MPVEMEDGELATLEAQPRAIRETLLPRIAEARIRRLKRMPRVVPSDVVALIDRMFPGSATEKPQCQTQWGVGQLGIVATLVDLVRELPEEFLTRSEEG